MRGPRIRKIAYVPEAERPVRNDLVRVLTAATASFYPKDARGDAMHAERWRVRIHRTRDLGKLRYTTSSVHLANVGGGSRAGSLSGDGVCRKGARRFSTRPRRLRLDET